MDLFVARQPVYDRRSRVVGYELLFRSGPFNGYDGVDHDRASAETIANSFFEIGVDRLVGNGLAFVNFTRNTLVEEYATVLPRERLVVEVLEDVVVDADVRGACERLKQGGYTLALDDYAPGVPSEGLLDLADIIKVDFRRVDEATRAELPSRRPSPGVKLLAEKVETPAELAEARELGYDLFQGYHFSRPEVRTGHRAPSALSHRLRLMQALARPEPDLAEIEELLKRDPSLAFKLLRYVNSAAFGLRVQARTLQKALAYLGQAGTRAWTMIAILADLGRNQPFELIATSVVRGRFCELVGRASGLAERAADLFLLGLFSMLDAITGRPLADAVAELPLAQDVHDTLLGRPTDLSAVLELARSYEGGNWPAVADLGGRLTLPGRELPPLYLAAVDWGNLSGHLA